MASEAEHDLSRRKKVNSVAVTLNVSEMQQKIDLLQEDLQEERNIRKEIQGRLNEAVIALSSLHTMDQYRRDDNAIANAVGDLRYDVKAWACQNFSVLPKFSQVFTQMFQKEAPLKAITPMYEKYIKSEADLPSFIQAFVWKALIDKVFDQRVWCGGSCEWNRGQKCPLYIALECLTTNFRISSTRAAHNPESYYNWRAQTTRIIENYSHRECVLKQIETITTKTKATLQPLTERKNVFFEGRHTVGATTLATIVLSAVQLDLLLWQQKANFHFRRTYTNSKSQAATVVFDPEIMEGDFSQTDENMAGTARGDVNVNLIIAPALEKFGTSEGSKYELNTIINKAVVGC